MTRQRLCLWLMIGLACLATSVVAAELPAGCGDEFLRLQGEVGKLQGEVTFLQQQPVLTAAELHQRSLRRFGELSREVQVQRQALVECEAYVRWLSGHLSGYQKYIEAGSLLAGFARVLPIPYAGQASLLAKFVAQGVLALNATASSLARYLGTSQQLLDGIALLDTVQPDAGKMGGLVRLADEQLLKEMADVRQRLASTTELAASTQGFLESLQHYLGSSDEYWQKTKAMFGRKDGGKQEKGWLAENLEALRVRTAAFQGRLRQFEEGAARTVPLVKSLAAYDELGRELLPAPSR